MKSSTTLALAVCASVAAFSMGRWNAAAPARQVSRLQDTDARSSRPLPKREPRAIHEETPTDPLASCERVQAEKVALLSSEERMALLADGALIYNSANQAAVLCGVISALTKEEIRDAANILGRIQDRGNGITQPVWDALYKQWGRVDPVVALAHFGIDAVSKSPADAKHVMAGWLETDSSAALAWATLPKQAPLEAAAAAYAITSSTGGDRKRLEAAILELPADSQMTRACLEDFFDLASLAGEGQTATAIYDGLAPSLRAAAWPVTKRRLTFAEPAEAAAWMEKHANDPGAVRDLTPDPRRDPFAEP